MPRKMGATGNATCVAQTTRCLGPEGTRGSAVPLTDRNTSCCFATPTTSCRCHPRGLTVLDALVHVVVGCALTAIFVDAWLVAGWISPIVVASGSMAPTLRGPHRAWTCRGCQREFVNDAESLPTAPRAVVCPYCQAANETDDGVDRPGDRVYVDRSAFVWRTPRRWEVIVLERPDMPSQWCVKRVVGLPGERIEIRGTEIWIDGRIATMGNAYSPNARFGDQGSKYALGPGEYFLLGDNSPHSLDSRSWPEAGIGADDIVGRVIRW